LKEVIVKDDTPGSRVAELSEQLDLSRVERFFKESLKDLPANNVRILVDKLDEGYEPDDVGIALVDGFVQAAIDVNSRNEEVQSTVFLRDNIFRAIALLDPDYTRNIEGQVIRLHWDAETLFAMICKRLSITFNNTSKNSKLWDRYTAKDIQNMDGFKYCLRHTLYRPRDALILFNNAFYNAKRHERDRIIKDDIDSTAHTISQDRLNDLHKEYDSIFPSLSKFTSAFIGGSRRFSVELAKEIVEKVMTNDSNPQITQQDINSFSVPIDVIRELYSVGYLGVNDSKAGKIIFCHDGKTPDKELANSNELLIHPCYWIALNLKEEEAEIEPEQIFDEYEIEVKAVATVQESRQKRIGQLMSDLDNLDTGDADADKFEEWAYNTLNIIYAGGLRNIKLQSRETPGLGRDIIATNHAETRAWKRVLEDHKSRQVTFEVKNTEELDSEDYQKTSSNLTGDFGNIGFIITRKKDVILSKKEQGYLKKIHNINKTLIVKLSSHQLKKQLSKMRSPEKYNLADKEMNSLLDTYRRKYLSKNK